MTTPIILFSDHPSAQSGLARITRDLALRIHEHLGDQFRVATLGHGSPGSSKLPFPQYHWRERDDFLPTELPYVVDDFCAGDPYVLMTIGDGQRFLPLADPKFSQDQKFGEWLQRERQSKRMRLWGYFPIDSHSVGGKLGPQLGHTLSHYDRRVVPSKWAKEIVRKTLPSHECAAIPHGIDAMTFNPRPKEAARDEFGARLAGEIVWPQSPMDVAENSLWIGIVATNQGRKDWGLGIAVVAEMAKTRPVTLWCHVDRLKSRDGWSILELLSDFGLLGSAIVTVGRVSDEVMAASYSAMDFTLGIGRGEGFGYPVFESIFCGTPCFSGFYGAQAEWMDDAHLVSVDRLRIEGPLNLQRPLYRVGDWMWKIMPAPLKPMRIPEELDWANVWPIWADWFREGVK